MTEREALRLFAQLHRTDLGVWLASEIARLQAQLVQQTEMVAIYRTQGEVNNLLRMQKLLAVAPERVSSSN